MSDHMFEWSDIYLNCTNTLRSVQTTLVKRKAYKPPRVSEGMPPKIS